MVPFEDDNIKAYKLLLRIEIAIRECLRRSLEESSGPKWRRLLPGELLKKVRDAQREENHPQFDYVCLGPLYYLTLGELIPMLQQKPGHPTAERFGGDSFIKQLENILGPRNALCHARRIPSVGLGAIESLYNQMETALTSKGFSELVATPDIGTLPEEVAPTLISWMNEAKDIILELRFPIPMNESYELAKRQYWWGAPELAGFESVSLDQAASLFTDYNVLPSGIGSASIRQRFCEDRSPLQVINNAVHELRRISL